MGWALTRDLAYGGPLLTVLSTERVQFNSAI